MKAVNQTRPHPQGDCLRACIASLLEYPIEAVPDFIVATHREGDRYPAWYLELQSWLNQRGFQYLHIELTGAVKWNAIPFPMLAIFFGNTAQGERHAIVGRAEDEEFFPVFDPLIPDGQPGETMLDGGILAVGLLVATDPHALARVQKALETVERLASGNPAAQMPFAKHPILESIRDTAREGLGRSILDASGASGIILAP